MGFHQARKQGKSNCTAVMNMITFTVTVSVLCAGCVLASRVRNEDPTAQTARYREYMEQLGTEPATEGKSDLEKVIHSLRESLTAKIAAVGQHSSANCRRNRNKSPFRMLVKRAQLSGLQI